MNSCLYRATKYCGFVFRDLNPEKFIDDSSFIQNQNPILYMAAGYTIDLGFFDSSLRPYITSKIIPGTTNQMSIGGNFSFKNIFEIGMGYKSIDYSYVMFMLKLKMGIDIGYATDFGVGDNSNRPRTGYELFAKYRF